MKCKIVDEEIANVLLRTEKTSFGKMGAGNAATSKSQRR